MAEIEVLPEFSQNGDKRNTGLIELNGFPAALKPARQWFNFLFNKITLKMNEVIQGLNSEVTARGEADAALQESIETEATTRLDADKALQTSINNEAATRENADEALELSITNEVTTRLHDDDVERAARIEGDKALDVRVTFLEEKPDQPAIGVGQAFFDRSGSRFSGVTYPNTTGKPLEVVIFLIGANDYATCDFFVGGEFVFSLANRDAAGQSKGCSVIIPVNSNCRIDGSFTSWRELG